MPYLILNISYIFRYHATSADVQSVIVFSYSPRALNTTTLCVTPISEIQLKNLTPYNCSNRPIEGCRLHVSESASCMHEPRYERTAVGRRRYWMLSAC